MTRPLQTYNVRRIGQVIDQAVTTFQNSDAVVRRLVLCALAACAFPAGAVVMLCRSC
ncbi:MAG TPA: hypothetical protein VLC46_20305 [Thermoanaerobaculia bacterium]|nr:hypothetical protein [Thermoanaerobaculia bacterium]